MTIPFEPQLFGYAINVHLVLEYAAFFVAYRYYVHLKKRTTDVISSENRLVIVLGAAIGALIGSRFMAYMENPIWPITLQNLLTLFNAKTIMGGLFGGLLGVELTKKIIGEKNSSGDLFTFPIILGIAIGRVGCFLMGTNEFTYGVETSSFLGMNLGDGLNRHPLALYEIVYLIALFIFLKKIIPYTSRSNGLRFQLFMIAYFGFRFLEEFLKPNEFYFFHLSSIQWLCIVCWIYYLPTLKKLITHAY